MPENGVREPVSSGVEPSGGGEARGQRDAQLTALLAGLVREQGRTGAADLLDLDPRTVATALKRGTLSRRVRTALERVADSGEGQVEGVEETEPDTETAALDGRLEEVEQQVRAAREFAEGERRALREEHARDLHQVERRLARLESLLPGEGLGPANGATTDDHPIVGGPAPRKSPQDSHDGIVQRHQPAAPTVRRRYPDLVTREPAPDDAKVYGEAWPLVDEWRRLWRVHERPGKGLAWLKREVRILELEVAMLQQHELTLPPATYPQRGLELHTHLGWRLQALANRRRARAWAQLGRWVRRGLVFALLAGVTTFMVLASASS